MQHATVYIDAQDAEYQKVLALICEDIKARRLLPFLGAGISAETPSDLPLANTLCRPLQKALWKSSRQVSRSSLPVEDVQTARQRLRLARLERLLDALQETYGREAIEYLAVLNGDVWNDNHAVLATLAAKNFLPFCVTLNFDLLIEKAIAAQGKASLTVCPLIERRFRSGTGEAVTTITKPHGSFVPTSAGNDPMVFLSGTLSQIGSYPSEANVIAFVEAIKTCPVLFVAGYSDDDWDIFPMVQDHAHGLLRVYWVEYATPAQVAARELPPPPKAPYHDALRQRVLPWLDQTSSPTILLVGNPKALFGDIAARLGLTLVRHPAKDGGVPPVSARAFMSGISGDERSLQTAVSLAILLQDTGEFSRHLLEWLIAQPGIRRSNRLAARVERVLTQTEHTDGNLRLALSHMRESLKCKKRALSEQMAEDVLWYGYENLCVAKRPNPLHPVQFCLLPLHLLYGLWLVSKAVRIAPLSAEKKVRTLAQYYRGDLVHSWGTLMLLFGHRIAPLTRPLYRLVCRMYDRAATFDPQLMASEYYWLRHTEARILTGRLSIGEFSTIGSRIERLRESYRILQNSVQIGNIYAYEALVQFCSPNGVRDRQSAVGKLKRAAREWRKGRKTMAAGRRRVIFFRRYIGDVNLWQALRLLLNPALADRWGEEEGTNTQE